MSILFTRADLDARALLATGEFQALARGLRDELQPLIDGPLDVPRDKALLSRMGGRCAIDGTYLRFSPFDARHICAQCGAEYAGGLHDRFRLYWYQLWLAERVLHAALLGVITDDDGCSAAAMTLLDRYCEQYLRYPNADNVLGPSRPFFSTYLESIWLLQLCVAIDTLEMGRPSPDVLALGARVRDRIIGPSVALVRSYDEGMSNRQVWNNAALLAGSSLLDDRVLFSRTLHGASGVEAHLAQALLFDGTWYEGENYHLFAHRGLWYCTQAANASGAEISTEGMTRMQEGFAAPFRTVLPDLTYPSRRDSQYKVSIRQLRFAESCELGLARGADPRVASMLARLYDPSIPRGETGRAETAADVERNAAGTGVRRDDLSWRTLMFAVPGLQPQDVVPLETDLLPAQGLGILRRARGQVYVSLDYGHSGGGHGHPDRLNLTLARNDQRWFDDPGTGSYVDRSLFWYRSTLAHNAPLVDGVSQRRVHGALLAFDDQGDAGWISASAELANDLEVRRTIVVAGGYLIDDVSWTSRTAHEIALPIHDVVEREIAPRFPVHLPAAGPEDGFGFLRDVEQLSLDSRTSLRLNGVDASDVALRGWLLPSPGMQVQSAQAPGPPGTTDLRPMLLARVRATSGNITSLWNWDGTVTAVRRERNAIIADLESGARHRHERKGDRWTIEIAGGRIRRIELTSDFAPPEHPRGESARAPVERHTTAHRLPAAFDLGEESYRMSELTWEGAGAPKARVAILRQSLGTVLVTVDVHVSDRLFVPLTTENRLDNEPASINGDSVQLYATNAGRSAGWLLVPEPGSVGMRPIDGWTNDLAVDARWRPTASGYHLEATLHIDPAAGQVGLDVLVNEVAHGRARRRGQLVLSGAHGEFVYLRGDRQDPDRLLNFSL